MEHKFNSAGATLIYKDLILLGKRIDSHNGQKVNFGGFWSIFGGEREPPEENPVWCARRELKEETSIILQSSDLKHLGALSRGIYFFDVYISHIDHIPKIKLNNEHTEYGWFDINYLDVQPTPIDDEMKSLIMNYHLNKK